MTPDPTLPDVDEAFRKGEIKEFVRHARLGFVDHAGFLKEVARLRKVGFKRITLKTGASGLQELAMALRWGAEAKIDLLTIDGAPGGTGVSPWSMMTEWGTPTLCLQALTNQFVATLQKRKIRVPDLAMAGGFSDETHVFKALALGARGLRSIMESLMLDVMCDLPGQQHVTKVVFSAAAVNSGWPPILLYEKASYGPNAPLVLNT